MVKFKELGFKSITDYQRYFFDTLLPTNKTYEYFVDWQKVKKHLNLYSTEISLLNSLIRKSRSIRKKEFEKLLEKYPEVVRVIPLLVAERVEKKKINIFDIDTQKFLEIDFNPSALKSNVRRILDFVENTGILSLMDEVKDLYDYLLGVEVGLDTNARKNRSGIIFERMIQERVEFLLKAKYDVIRNDPDFSLYPKIRKTQKGKPKRHDVVIYHRGRRGIPLGIIGCNFYNTTGSKPASIAESYIEMYSVARENGIVFVWVTDGPAWLKMKEPLYRAMKEIEWILNFRMVNKIQRIFGV